MLRPCGVELVELDSAARRIAPMRATALLWKACASGDHLAVLVGTSIEK
jgi:hypothetical protein